MSAKNQEAQATQEIQETKGVPVGNSLQKQLADVMNFMNQMKSDMATIKAEVTVANQRAEIAELKLKLANTEIKKEKPLKKGKSLTNDWLEERVSVEIPYSFDRKDLYWDDKINGEAVRARRGATVKMKRKFVLLLQEQRRQEYRLEDEIRRKEAEFQNAVKDEFKERIEIPRY